jgi:hypothetical protein
VLRRSRVFKLFDVKLIVGMMLCRRNALFNAMMTCCLKSFWVSVFSGVPVLAIHCRKQICVVPCTELLEIDIGKGEKSGALIFLFVFVFFIFTEYNFESHYKSIVSYWKTFL